MIVIYHWLSESIVYNQDLLFNSKFMSLPCYFINIKLKISTTFYLQIDGQTKWQNSMIDAYLRILLIGSRIIRQSFMLMAKFAYNNIINANTCHMSFELNCGYYFCLFFGNRVDLFLRFYFIDKIAK